MVLASFLPRFIHAGLGAILAVAAVPAGAAAEEWAVQRLAGEAWVTSPLGTRSNLAVGMTIVSGATVVTGERARAMLVRGRESMVIGPVSVIAIVEHPTQSLSTTVIEKAGSVTFDVEHRNVQHFAVETPMLAAVVKGTRFTVAVGRANGGVGVTRGAVQVTALASGQVGTVVAGQRASVDHRGLSVSGRAGAAAVQAGPPRAPMVAPASEVSPASLVTSDEVSGPRSATSVGSGAAPATSNQHSSTHDTGLTASSQRSASAATSPGGLVGAISAAVAASVSPAASSRPAGATSPGATTVSASATGAPASAGPASAGQVSAGQIATGQVSAGQVSGGQASTSPAPSSGPPSASPAAPAAGPSSNGDHAAVGGGGQAVTASQTGSGSKSTSFGTTGGGQHGNGGESKGGENKGGENKDGGGKSADGKSDNGKGNGGVPGHGVGRGG